MLEINLKNGVKVLWKNNEFDDYEYDGKVLIIYKMHRLIGMYNVNNIISVIYKNENKNG
jgi:hypothetical protein